MEENLRFSSKQSKSIEISSVFLDSLSCEPVLSVHSSFSGSYVIPVQTKTAKFKNDFVSLHLRSMGGAGGGKPGLPYSYFNCVWFN